MANSEFRRQAEEFLVWREGKKLNWTCTYVELAAECGLSVGRVDYICRKRGWKCRAEGEVYSEINDANASQMADLVSIMSVDTF
jgi:hypothetical protein